MEKKKERIKKEVSKPRYEATGEDVFSHPRSNSGETNPLRSSTRLPTPYARIGEPPSQWLSKNHARFSRRTKPPLPSSFVSLSHKPHPPLSSPRGCISPKLGKYSNAPERRSLRFVSNFNFPLPLLLHLIRHNFIEADTPVKD